MKTNFRTAITIPEKSWSRFRDIMDDYVDKMKAAEAGAEAEEARSPTPTPPEANGSS